MRSIESEIVALERRLGMRKAQPVLLDEEVLEPDLMEEDLDVELEEPMMDEDLIDEDVMMPMSQDEDEDLIAMLYSSDEDDDELRFADEQDDLEKEAETITKEDDKVIEDSNDTITVPTAGEDQNTKVSRQLLNLARQLEAADEGVEDTISQPFAEVENLEDVEDETESSKEGDVLPVAEKKKRKASEDRAYFSRLREASWRLDRVSNVLEKKGGNWKRLAFRLDQLADTIDSERRVVAKRIASA